MKTTSKQIKKKSTVRSKTRQVVQPLRKKVHHHARKILVPHKVNAYRPHLIRLQGITAVLIVAVLAQVVYGYTTTGNLSVLGRVSDVQAVELFQDTNNERKKAGVSELTLNDKLSEAAFMRAQDMFEKNYWSHVSPTGVQPWKWFADVGYNYSYAGENLAKNYPNAGATVEAWMNSPSHRENILNTHYTEIGFAVVDGVLNGQNTTLVVALYGAPVTAAAFEEVAGASSFQASAVTLGAQRPFEYFGNALQSLSPVTIVVLLLLGLVAVVGVIAHRYRNKLPKNWRQSWKAHHGMYTFVGMLALGILIIIGTGGGTI